jgi:hypothetical protein
VVIEKTGEILIGMTEAHFVEVDGLLKSLSVNEGRMTGNDE